MSLARRRAVFGRPGRAWSLAAASAAASAFVAATPGDSGAGATPPPKTVTLRDIAFTPSTLRLERGRSVRWVWKDPFVAHDVRSRGLPRFRGATTRQSGSHTVQFTRRGTYRYVCTLHPGMAGRIVVR